MILRLISWLSRSHSRPSLGIGRVRRARHRFGTDVFNASKDIRLTQELMGHASPTTTAIYAEADMSKMSSVLQTMRERRSA